MTMMLVNKILFSKINSNSIKANKHTTSKIKQERALSNCRKDHFTTSACSPFLSAFKFGSLLITRLFACSYVRFP